VVRFQHDLVRSTAFSPDSSILAIACADGVGLLVDARDGRLLHELRGHDGEMTDVAFSPDGTQVATCGADQTVRLWNVRNGTGQSIWRGHTFGVRAVAFRSDGRQVASAGQDGSVKLWDVQRDPRCLSLLVERYGEWLGDFAIRLRPAGAELISVSRYAGDIQTWDAARGARLGQTQVDLVKSLRIPGSDTAFNSDAAILAGPSRDDPRIIKLWEVATGRTVQTLAGHTRPVMSIAFDATSQRVATAAWGRSGREPAAHSELNLWDRASGQRVSGVQLAPDELPLRLAFSPDGSLLAAAGTEGSVVVRDPSNGNRLFALDGFHGTVSDIAFSPDGRLLAAVSSDDPTVRIWDLASRRVRHTLRGQKHALTSLAFSPDGRRLASVGFEGIVKLWDVESGQGALSLTGLSLHRPADYRFNARVLFSADGTRIVANAWDGRIHIWDIASPPSAGNP
jgi:WD40 repeat protein